MAGGVRAVHGGGGHAQGGCVVGGGMCGRAGGGMCGVGGVCVVGGMHGRGGMCGGHAWQGVCVAGGAWQGGYACHTHTPWQILRPRHTVNERAVRILLECILVYTFSGIACYQLPPLSRGSCRNISSIESKLQSHMMAPGRITSSH